MIASILWILHPLHGNGYQFWSGFEGGIETLVGWLVLASGWYWHHTCQKAKCLRLGHPHPEHGRPVCRRHYHHSDVEPSR